MNPHEKAMTIFLLRSQLSLFNKLLVLAEGDTRLDILRDIDVIKQQLSQLEKR